MYTDFLATLNYLGITADNLVPLLIVFLLLDRRIEDKLTSVRSEISEVNSQLNLFQRSLIEIQVVLVNAGHKLTQVIRK